MNQRVLILGGGFAGLHVARRLAHSPYAVTVLDQHNYHLFQPLLYQVAAGDLQGNRIATPLRSQLRAHNLRFRYGRAEHIDLAKRQVLCDDGSALSWDKLVLATGSVTNFFGNDAIQSLARHLKGLGAAEALRSGILQNLELACQVPDPESQSALLHFCIAGGGPTGVEFCGALLELLRIILPREYPELPALPYQVTLIQGGEHLLPGFAPFLQKRAEERLGAMGADLLLGVHVKGYDGEWITLDNGTRLHSKTLVWAAGVQASPLAAQIPGGKAHGGRIPVDLHCRLPQHPEVYIAGDLAYGEEAGTPWPQVAPFARQSAQHIAKHLLLASKGGDLPPFHYRDPGSMAVLRSFDAVCQLTRPPMRFTGFPAWGLWLGLHIYSIIGTRNRLATLLDWYGDYWRHTAANTLIR